LRTKKVGSAGRMGSRYGWRLRRQLREVDLKAKASYQCSRCGKLALRRVGTGIWRCSKCGSVFAGGAYTPAAAESGIVG